MPLKRSSFRLSSAILRKNVQRFWPLWSAYLGFWLLAMPAQLLECRNYPITTIRQQLDARVLQSAGSFSVVVILIYSALAALAVWSYLDSARSVGLFHALPVGRGGLFLTQYCSGLLFVLLPQLAAACAALLTECSMGHPGGVIAVLQWLAAVSLQGVFFFSLATLAAMLTGHILAHPAIYLVLNFIAAGCEYLLRAIGNVFLYGVYDMSLQLAGWSPALQMMKKVSVELAEGQTRLLGFGWLLLYGGVGLVLAAGALLLYRKRRSESAGDFISAASLRPVAKYVFAFGFSLCFGMLLKLLVFPGNSSELLLSVCVLGGGLIGYFAAEMLMKKSFRVFRFDWRGWKGFLCFAAVMTALAMGLHFDVLGIEKKVPQPDEIKSLRLSSYYELTMTDEADLALAVQVHQRILDNRNDALERTYANDYETPAQGIRYVRFSYRLNNGKTLERAYQVPYDLALVAEPSSAISALLRVMNDPQNLMQEYLPPQNAIIESVVFYKHTVTKDGTDEQTGDGGYQYLDTQNFAPLLAAIRKDVLTGGLGCWTPQRDRMSSRYSFDITYRVPDEKENGGTQGWIYMDIFEADQAEAVLSFLRQSGYLKEGE